MISNNDVDYKNDTGISSPSIGKTDREVNITAAVVVRMDTTATIPNRKEISRNLHRLKRRMFLRSVQQQVGTTNQSLLEPSVEGLRTVLLSAAFEGNSSSNNNDDDSSSGNDKNTTLRAIERW
eukprot:CAMPEP_0194170042 /NCGR_PEP_ID=MMETSP0154-20130528/4699_1 /TAXON_ID=1049557 /ORGANISM="Thalassiothrix antarctica, Strain L6-D1" /LENGTH=122 /DNA_ID=CAMNT_0038881723 /DNA_START=55 /DNA_END=420 /DNA_ORIENTATION=+